MTGTRPLRAVYTRGAEADRVEDAPAPAETANGATMLAARRLAPDREELGAVIDEFMQAAEEGEAEDGYGQPYTAEDLRELHSALSHVKSELGTMHVRAIGRWHVQGMLDELRRAGLAPGRLTAVVEALHALYSYAIERGLVEDSPVIFLTFPQRAERPEKPERSERTERVRAPTAKRPARPREPDYGPEYQPEPTATPTPTDAMVALGGRVLSWTVRATLTVFVLIAIVLVVEFV